jgi:3-hydroxybutyryl-CoA dehydrogenase
MNMVLVVGDGPLAYQMIGLLEASERPLAVHTWGETGLSRDPLEGLDQTLARHGGDIGVVIEAALADRDLKRSAWEVINATLIRSDILFLPACLNASATEVNGWLDRAEYLAGWAALPPLAGGSLVEIMGGLGTDPGAFEAAGDFFLSLGRTAVPVGESVGGVVPRVVISLINNAAFALMEGVASAEDIDTAMKLGTNYPYGPLAWGDLIGLEGVLGVLESLAAEHGPERYRPAPILRHLVRAGHWGVRTGRGFYGYEG